MTRTDKVERLVICRADFFMDTEARFFGARSRSVSEFDVLLG